MASRLLLIASVDFVGVTGFAPEEMDGVELDRAVAEAVGLLDGEKVEVACQGTGARFACCLRLIEGSGEMRVCGPASRLVNAGERLTLSAYGWVKTKAVPKHQPRLLRVDEGNRVLPAKKSKAT